MCSSRLCPCGEGFREYKRTALGLTLPTQPNLSPHNLAPHLNVLPLYPNIFFHRETMTFDGETIIDLLDELDLDIQGFEDTPKGSLLFPLGCKNTFSFPACSTKLFSVYDRSEASTSALVVAPAQEDFPPFELLEEIELSPRKWVAAGPSVWDDMPQPTATRSCKDAPPCRDLRGLAINVPPRTPSRSASRPLPKENMPSPTDRSFARLRDRGSSCTLSFPTRPQPQLMSPQ